MMNELDSNFEDYEAAEIRRGADFSSLTADDVDSIVRDDNGDAFGMSQGIPIPLSTKIYQTVEDGISYDIERRQDGSEWLLGKTGEKKRGVAVSFGNVEGEKPGIDPGEEEGGVFRDIRRGLSQGAFDAGKSLNEALPILGKPVDLVNEGVGYVGDVFGLDLRSDYPVGGSEMIRDGVEAIVDFADFIMPDALQKADIEFRSEKASVPLLQEIVTGITEFGVQAVTPAMYLRAFSAAGPFARGIAWGGVADFINAQPDDATAIASLTEFLTSAQPEERSAVANAVIDVFAAQKEDPEFINRARVALDGMVIGGAVEKGVEYLVRASKMIPWDRLQESIVQAGGRADERLASMAAGTTLSANPVGAAGDLALSAAGKLADRRRIGTTGQYIGAPPGVNSPQKLAALRKKVSSLAKEGAAGRLWYERSSKEILDAVGGDVDEADRLIQAIAVTSPGTPVKNNLDYALQAYSQWKAGAEIKTGRFPTAMSKKLNEIFSGQEWAGRKTDDFYNNLMIHIAPDRVGPVTGDLWMVRAFGFTKPNEMPSQRQYEFITKETQRIAKKLGWQPHQVQAAIWVAMKGRSENPQVKTATEASSEKRGWIKFETNARTGKKERVVIDQAKHLGNWLRHALKHDLTDADIDRAKFDYADALADNRGQVSWESIPGRTSNHMPEMFNAPYEQQAEYHVAISKVFLDEDGSDLVAKRLGVMSPGDFEAPGFFEGKVSPGTQTSAFMPRQYKGPESGQIEQSAEDLISAYAAVRGILMKQDGVGFHRPFYQASRKNSNAVQVDVGRPFTEAETKRLADIISKLAGHGEYAPIAHETGARFVNFDYLEFDNLDFQSIIEKALDAMEFDGGSSVTAKRFHAYTGYAGNDWKVGKNGESYMDGRWARRSDLQGRVRDIIRELQPRIDEIDQDFADRYGWSVNDAINANYREDGGLIPPSDN